MSPEENELRSAIEPQHSGTAEVDPKDETTARKYYQMAADFGHEDARDALKRLSKAEIGRWRLSWSPPYRTA